MACFLEGFTLAPGHGRGAGFGLEGKPRWAAGFGWGWRLRGGAFGSAFGRAFGDAGGSFAGGLAAGEGFFFALALAGCCFFCFAVGA